LGVLFLPPNLLPEPRWREKESFWAELSEVKAKKMIEAEEIPVAIAAGTGKCQK
jgi:hypothetical protein